MRILGLDTSGKIASAALLDTEQDILLGERSLYTTRGHSQVILPMVEGLLADCGLTLPDVDCYAVSVGPGSYTGLRIGIAAVQGMAMVRNTPCIGVSTLEAMASRITAPVLSVMHARADLFYAALFAGKRLTEDKLLTAAELTELAASRGDEELLLTGDGAAEFLRQYTGTQNLRPVPAHLRLQSAAGVCAAAADKKPGTPSELTASYLQAVNITKKN